MGGGGIPASSRLQTATLLPAFDDSYSEKHQGRSLSLESAGSALALCSFSPSMPGSSEDWIYSAMPCSLSAVAGLPYRSHTLLHMCSFTLVPHTWLWSAIFLSSFMSSLFLRASFHRTCLFFVVPGILQVQEAPPPPGLPGSSEQLLSPVVGVSRFLHIRSQPCFRFTSSVVTTCSRSWFCSASSSSCPAALRGSR